MGLVVVVALVIGLITKERKPDATGIDTYQGTGVTIDLPNNWAAGPDPRDLPPPTGLDRTDTEAVTSFLNLPDLVDERTRLVGYEGIRTMVMIAAPVPARTSLSTAAKRYVDLAAGSELSLVLREDWEIDGNPAERLVLRNEPDNETVLAVIWFDGDLSWTALWDTTTEDFYDAETVFNTAMISVETDPGA